MFELGHGRNLQQARPPGNGWRFFLRGAAGRGRQFAGAIAAARRRVNERGRQIRKAAAAQKKSHCDGGFNFKLKKELKIEWE